jgi:glycogen synthase
LALFPNKERWRALQVAGMAVDHSWDRSAQEYVKIYERAVDKGLKARGLVVSDSGLGARG